MRCRCVTTHVDMLVSTHKLEKEMSMQFNVKRLVQDCGGVRAVAEIMGKTRTAPYRMMRTNYMGTNVLAKVLEANPSLNLNDYFEKRDNDNTHTK